MYTYAPNSEFDRLLQVKLSCPTCGLQGCGAAENHNAQCSNNPEVIVHALPFADPTLPETLPKKADQTTQDVQTFCGVGCKSQKDCQCTGYLCAENPAITPRLRASSKTCVYVASMASPWPRA